MVVMEEEEEEEEKDKPNTQGTMANRPSNKLLTAAAAATITF